MTDQQYTAVQSVNERYHENVSKTRASNTGSLTASSVPNMHCGSSTNRQTDRHNIYTAVLKTLHSDANKQTRDPGDEATARYVI